ncbi:MAG: TGS domain-containing protein, partial [Nitrospira sp.]
MPLGSTPVDFAYAIHTEIGDHCVGAKANGKIVPLRHSLKSGETVEILTSPTQVPHKDWLKFVRTSRAKAKIKHWLKNEQHQRSTEVGRRLLEREFKQQNLAPAQMLKSDRLLDVAKKSGYATLDELVAAVGFGHVAASEVASWLLAPAPAVSSAPGGAPQRPTVG